jgi:CBS domain-containing protein
MRRECAALGEEEPLEGALRRMREGSCSALPVLRAGRLVGLLTLENVGELLMVSTALRERGGRSGIAEVFATD